MTTISRFPRVALLAGLLGWEACPQTAPPPRPQGLKATIKAHRDALTNPRPYGPRWSWSSVLAYLRQEGGHLYDADVVSAVCERIKEIWVIESMCQSYQQDLLTDR